MSDWKDVAPSSVIEALTERIERPESRDMVNSPSHYKVFQKEAVELIQEALSPEEFKGYLLGNMLKYRLRAGFKDKNKLDEDLKKSNWYLNKFESLTDS